MVTHRIAVALMLSFAVAGCANNNMETGAPQTSSSPTVVPSEPPVSSEPPPPSTEPGAGKTETVSGTVTAGVEPGCLLVQDAKGSHQLVFDDTALRAVAKVGAKVTVTGRSQPGQMSTCQQGIPFIVTSVRAG